MAPVGPGGDPGSRRPGMTRKEIHLVQTKHSAGSQQRLRRCTRWPRLRVHSVRPSCPRMSQGANPVLLKGEGSLPGTLRDLRVPEPATVVRDRQKPEI